MREPLRIRYALPTGKDLAIGRGVPTGPNASWVVLELRGGPPLMIHYDDQVRRVRTALEWSQAPDHGVVAITGSGWIAKNADEYRWRQVSKYGLYVDDEVYDRVIRAAIAEAAGG